MGDVIWDKKSKQWTEYFNPTVSNPQEILRIVQATVACIDHCPRVEERWTQREEAWYCKVIEE